MLSVVAGGVALFCLWRQIDEQVRCRVEARLAEHYEDLKVRVRSAQLVEGHGIRVRDVKIVDPSVSGADGEILHVEEMLLDCPTDWRQLLEGNPPVRRITIRRPTLHIVHRADGTWSTACLLPLPSLSSHPPEVVWQDGSIEIVDARKPSKVPVVLRDVNMVVAPDKKSGAVRQIRGTLAGEGVRRVEFEGWIDPRASSFSLRGKASNIEVSPELRESLPKPLVARLAALGELRGLASMEFQLSHDHTATPACRFSVSGRLTRGRLDVSEWPQSLADIRADFRANNAGVSIENLSARCGSATLRLACKRNGFEPNSPLWVSAEVRRMELDRSLLAVLPPVLKDQWYKYLPSGQIDADVELNYDGTTWRPEVLVQCLNVSFTHHKFPYRMEQGRGTLELKGDVLKANLTAHSGSGRQVRIGAEISHPLNGPIGWFEARGDDIPLDESLIAALPVKPRAVVRSLDPRGAISFYTRMWRNKPGEKMHKHLQVALNRCAVQYEKFPYPLSNIRGILEMFDGHWNFRDLEGSNQMTHVTCEGSLAPSFEGNELVLRFVGHDVALGEELRDALKPNIQQVWHDIRPRGVVDLTAEVRYLPERKKFSVSVRAEAQRDTASIEPVHFPYRLDRLQGVLVYRDGHVEVQGFKGEHGAVKVASEVSCDFQPDGRWEMRFADISVDRLRADHDLIKALPDRLKKAVIELSPTGPVNLHGNFNLERVGPPGDPLRSSWEMRIGLQQNSLQCGGLPLENICGEVSLGGTLEGNHLQCRGNLAVDSLHYKDFQLTQINGPFWIDDHRVLFGSWVDRREDKTIPRRPTPVRAALFGGAVFGDGWVTLGPESRYAMNLTLTDADLTRCSRDLMGSRQNLRGKIVATADLSGAGRSRNALSGRGGIRLTNADVYELPVMISLLKILSIRPPDQKAFSDAVIDYRIEGEHIYFDRIDFRGDAISLRGQGEMDFQSAIRLTFYALVGRGELEVPVIKQVFRGASQQLMCIHVDGTLHNPETRKEALPVLNQALQQIREELQTLR